MLPNYMHSFQKDARATSRDPMKPPNAISGEALDQNYAACLPIIPDGPNKPYLVRADKDGWTLEPTLTVLVCQDGRPTALRLFGQRLGTEIEPEA
jgi:hypothetical protein